MRDDIFHTIQVRLIEKEKLPVAYAAILAAEALNGFAPELRQAVQRWAEGESIADAALDGSTVRDIQNEVGGSEFQALCLLNDAVRYPGCFEDAVLTLQRDIFHEKPTSDSNLDEQGGKDRA